MSRNRSLDAINLKATDCIPSQEWLDHPGFIEKIVGFNPYDDPEKAYLESIKELDIDWIIDIPEVSYNLKSKEVIQEKEKGTFVAEWGLSGTSWQKEYQFKDVEEVLSFDPLTDTDKKTEVTSRNYIINRFAHPVESQRALGDATLVTGLYYTTLFQFFIMSFGWELFLVAAGSEPKRFKKTIEKFALLSMENVKLWIKNNLSPVFFCHDDLAISDRLVFPPQWYRDNIFPWYKKILAPAKEAGKKIIFVSDGNYLPLIEDLFSLEIDGIMIDPSIDLEYVLHKWGRDKVIIGNIDTAILTYGTEDDIKREVARCVAKGENCPGYFFKASGDLPHNIPLENIQAYFEFCHQLGKR